ncbi:MAG: hypothetical protein GXW96_09485 [Christensenellaceae bacterium]|nr:hypothetical protein [Christensenellaceae bacterium]
MAYVLSRDADALICVLYNSYLQRIKQGEKRSSAVLFGGSESIQSEIPNWDTDRIDEACRELDRNNYLTCVYGDDVVVEAALTSDAIVYMEQRFKRGLDEVLGYIQTIRSILLG